jgi:hypothetical protein
MHARQLWPVAVVLLAACGGDGVLGLIGRVEIRTEQVQYTPGDMLRVSVRNESDRTLYYSGCGMIVERIDPDDPDSSGFGTLCLLSIDVPVPIRPGTELRDSIEIPLQTRVGSYRVRLLVMSGSKPLPEPLRLSNPFAIE